MVNAVRVVISFLFVGRFCLRQTREEEEEEQEEEEEEKSSAGSNAR